MLHRSFDRPTPHERAILRTVVYASLFDYPLTARQVRESLIGAALDEDAIVACWRTSPWLQAVVECRDGWFFPRGCAGFLEIRRRRETASRALIARQRRLIRLIGCLPFTRLVALSGSAAHLNAEADGDLDLFIVTRGARVWSVTLTIVALARLARRRALVCANYVMSDRDLRVDEQDLFSANQIIHLRPIVGGEGFPRFAAANPCVGRHYPGFVAGAAEVPGLQPGRAARALKRAIEVGLSLGDAQAYEATCRFVYGRHLRARAHRWRSPEQVRLALDRLKLHTHSHRRAILERFEREAACAEAAATVVARAGRAGPLGAAREFERNSDRGCAASRSSSATRLILQ